jgi:hypothetical protein
VKRIPIYDATAPITCTADGNELAARVAQLERLHRNLARVERSEDGILLHFPNRPEIEADVRQFAVDEKGCCQFWGFEVTTSADGILLRWDGPPEVSGFMDDVMRRLEADEPITAASGLL